MHIAQADAAEVQRLAALAAVLPTRAEWIAARTGHDTQTGDPVWIGDGPQPADVDYGTRIR